MTRRPDWFSADEKDAYHQDRLDNRNGCIVGCVVYGVLAAIATGVFVYFLHY